MRDYAAVSPCFWTGRTGREIRACGPTAQLVALYLLTCPSSNMIGLFYLPLATLTYETGIPFEGASKALRSLQTAGFAFHDAASDLFWVPEMARFQIAETLEAKDNRVKGILRELRTFASSVFYGRFVERYNEPFNLGIDPQTISPFEAPSKPLRSQDQDQDQEQEHEQEHEQLPLSAGGGRQDGEAVLARSGAKAAEPPGFSAFWNLYPRKNAKGDALKAWRQTAKRRPPLEELLAAVERGIASHQWQKEGGQFIPMPAGWLRKERWGDTYAPANGSRGDHAAAIQRGATASLIRQAEEWENG